MNDRKMTIRPDAFVVGALISTLGSSLTNMALVYQFLLNSSSPSSYAIILYGSTATSVIFASRIGMFIDSRKQFGRLLIWTNLVSAGCSVGFAFSGDAFLSSGIVSLATMAAIINSTAIAKLTRIYYIGTNLDRVTITLNEIATLGMVFGPLFAPMLTSIGVTLDALYFVDAASFLFAGVMYFLHFKSTFALNQMIHGTLNFGSHSSNFVSKGWSIVVMGKMKPYFITFIPYVLGWSGLIYSLAILAKQMSGNSTWRYSAPIIAMFFGRLVAMNIVKRMRLQGINYGILFSCSLATAALAVFPMGFVDNIYLFCGLEFVLGMAVAINLLSTRLLLQRLSPLETLATAQGLSMAIEKVAKLLSVPLLVWAISLGGSAMASALLGGFFLIAAICAVAQLPSAYSRVVIME